MYGRRLHSTSHASPAVNRRFTGLAFRCQKTQYFDSTKPAHFSVRGLRAVWRGAYRPKFSIFAAAFSSSSFLEKALLWAVLSASELSASLTVSYAAGPAGTSDS